MNWQLQTLRNLIAGLLLAVTVFTAYAQSYSVDWSKISGGGGTSTGGVFSISGTIGQHDASGAMNGGNFSLTGGYWSLIQVVQTPGLPNLTLTHTGNSVTISWPTTSTTTLQQNANLANAAGWVTSDLTVTTVNGTSSVTITTTMGNLFFRLSSP